MALKTLGTELADLEFRRISTIAWPTIAILFSVQTLTSNSAIAVWQIYFICGIAITVVLSLLIQWLTNLSHSFLPFALYMLLSPLVIGESARTPWMSFGLLTVTASIYFATINPWPLAIVSIIALGIFEVWMVRKDLPSFTDQRDMELLGGYFATVWMIGIGIFVCYIRNQYLSVSVGIEEQIESLKESISRRLQGISKQNREDYRNLKLHGTVLNTLIYARNNLEYLVDRNSLISTLKNELFEMRKTNSELTFKNAINAMLNKRENARIQIASIAVTGEVYDLQIQNSYVEVIREILLNLEKHTTATVATITVSTDRDKRISIEVTDNSGLGLGEEERSELATRASKSRSLSRLLGIIPAQLFISSSQDGLTYKITPLASSESVASSIEIHETRNQGILSFALNLIKAVSLIGILYIPGYFFLSIDPSKVALLIVQAITLFLLAFRISFSALLLAVSTWISIATPAFLSINVTTCSQVTIAPWMANIGLAATLSFAMLSKERITRWLPLGLFTLELLVLPLSYPDECKNIYFGTLPGIPLIISFYIVISSIRKRAFNEDSQMIRAVYEDEANVEKTEALLNYEFKQQLSRLEGFSNDIEKFNQEDFIPKIDLEIQRIRAFLICSEQFESQVVRDFYGFAMSRLDQEKSTRISIMGDNFFELDNIAGVSQILDVIDSLLDVQPAEISLLHLDEFIIDIAVNNPAQMIEKTSHFSSIYPQVKIAIRSLT
jgi:signal transduction histidine kinase